MQKILCSICKNYLGDLTCLAFPLGIPEDILIGSNEHDRPTDGQNNKLVYESIDGIELHKVKNYSPDEKLIPAGHEGGGRWTSGTVGDVVPYVPNKKLSEEGMRAERAFGQYLNDHYSEAKARYLKVNGNVVAADLAKELSDDFMRDPTKFSMAVHEPSSSFAKKLYSELLQEPSQTNKVVFTAGGTGAGKTSSINNSQDIKNIAANSDIVFDTNLAKVRSAEQRINEALATGRKVIIVYVYRDPVDAFENGVVPRMQKTGRAIAIDTHIRTHEGSLQSVLALRDIYKGNNNVIFKAIDNSLGRGNAREISFDELAKKSYISYTDVKKQLYETVKQKRESHSITGEQYKALTHHTKNKGRLFEDDSKRSSGLLRESDGREFEQEHNTEGLRIISDLINSEDTL